jgi:hypothetical protein
VAFFSTGDGEEPDALMEIEKMLGSRVLAEMHLVRKKEIDADSYHDKISDFTEKIKSFIQ